MSPSEKTIPGPEEIAESIIMVRGQRVLLDTDLARIYGVSTGRLNEQVKRNARRFPEDFVFQLTREEAERIRRSRSQNAILEKDVQLAAVIEALRQLTAPVEPAHDRKMGFRRGNR